MSDALPEARDEPRIGVFVCHCGTNIGGVVDVPAVVEYVRTLPYVVHAERNLYTCAADGLTAIKKAIKEHSLNRVVVASCTPRTHAPLFMSACEDAGLNPYLFEFVNIRDQCSWVHLRDKENATEKAKHLIRMGTAKAALLKPLQKIQVAVENSALVIGGGISGLIAANALANQGIRTYLVEKEKELGGMLRSFNKVYPYNLSASQLLKPLVDCVMNNKSIKLMLGSEVKEVKGYIGNFDVRVESAGNETSFKVGVIIVSTGAEVYRPDGFYGYGQFKNVITQLELEKTLANGALKDLKSVVIILCVGSRGQKFSYCSRICCKVALKNALEIKSRNPETDVMILYRDIQAYGVEYEKLYRDAREQGVRFIRYTLDRIPELKPEGGEGLLVSYYDNLLQKESERFCDYVILTTPMIQHPDIEQLSKTLKVPLGPDKFFFEAHVKLRPLDFATDGIYLCGTAHGPKDIAESVSQSLGAVSHVLAPLRSKTLLTEPLVSVIDKELCIGCGSCAPLCPYNAIALKQDGEILRAECTPSLCKGCGVCAVICPSHHDTDAGIHRRTDTRTNQRRGED